MEFSYRIGKAEFLQASKLRDKKNPVFVIFKVIRGIILFWVSAVVFLVLLWVVVQHGASAPTVTHQPTAGHVSVWHTFIALAPILGPFFLLLAAPIFLLFGFEPMRARWLYKKDPSMHGQFTVSITQGAIAIQNTAGTSSKFSWNVYDYWCERKGVIVLMLHSGSCSVLSLAGLSGAQQDELRGILTVALKKR